MDKPTGEEREPCSFLEIQWWNDPVGFGVREAIISNTAEHMSFMATFCLPVGEGKSQLRPGIYKRPHTTQPSASTYCP